MTSKIFEFMEADIPQKYWAVYDWENRKTNRFRFMKCQRLPETADYDLILDVRGPTRLTRRFDVLANTFDSPLVNQKALHILQDLCPEDFQVFPARIQATDGVIEEYVILNLLHEIDHVNYEESDAKYFTDNVTIRGFDHLVMRPGALEGHHMGRLEDMHPFILVSEELVAAFKKVRIKGTNFIPIDLAGDPVS